MWCRLGEIAQHNTGKTLDKSRNTGNLQEYITTSNLYWGYFDFTELRKMPIEDNELDRCTAIFGDLLICEGGDAGRSAVWKSEKPICFQNHIHRIRPFAKIYTSYLYYFMQLIYLNGEIKQYLKGVGIQSLSGNALASILLPIPPLQEQQHIVSKIEECFVLIDQIEENKRFLSQFIKQTKSKVLDLAIRGKLVPQDPNDEPASVLLERIKKEQKAKKPTADILHYPIEVPKNWTWCRLGEIVFSIKNGSTMKQSKGALGIPITRIETISDGSVNYGRMGYANIFDSLDYASYILKENDILMSHINSPIHVGKTAIYKPKEKNEKIIHGMNLLRIRLQYVINSDFANYFFNSQFFKDSISPYIKNAVNQASINIGNLNIIQIPIPPLPEQHRIVTKIEQIFAQLDEIENSIKA